MGRRSEEEEGRDSVLFLESLPWGEERNLFVSVTVHTPHPPPPLPQVDGQFGDRKLRRDPGWD